MKTIILLIGLYSIIGINKLQAQDLKVGAKNYAIIKNEILNQQTEYLILSDKVTKKQSGFIKSNNEIKPTVFSELEFTNLFTTGNVSSLGKLVEVKIKNAVLRYIIKGEKKVFISRVKGGGVRLFELPNELKILQYDGGGGTPEQNACSHGCITGIWDCWSQMGYSFDDCPTHNCPCELALIECDDRCKTAFPQGPNKYTFNSYLIKNMSVQFK
jgi:hypothetical protein